jgi:uncharacterized protein
VLAICQLPPDDAVPGWVDLSSRPLVSITRTDHELSIVLPQARVPAEVPAAGGWCAMSVRGPLPFHLTGIMASLAAPLADAGVPIFVLSTHDTDWLLVGQDRVADATAALEAAGHRIHQPVGPTDRAPS